MSYACRTCGRRSEKKHCPRHTPKDHRPSSTKRGYDRRWERTRASYLASHPTCEQHGCEEAAQDVHHLDGLGPLGPDGHDPGNLEALCHSHHSQRTASEQPAGWHGMSIGG